MQILANGDVIPSARCVNGPMGNVYKEDIKSIWKGEKFVKFRKETKGKRASPVCTRCCGLFSRRCI